MQGTESGIRTDLDGSGLRIGIVRARFNTPITEALSESCSRQLQTLGVRKSDIVEITVPGALEVPVALYGMADRAEFDALVALGCIIRGETYHFEMVANQSGAGVAQVSLEYGVPIANAILTVENEEQAWARAAEKGQDAACVAVEMALLMTALSVDGDAELSADSDTALGAEDHPAPEAEDHTAPEAKYHTALEAPGPGARG